MLLLQTPRMALDGTCSALGRATLSCPPGKPTPSLAGMSFFDPTGDLGPTSVRQVSPPGDGILTAPQEDVTACGPSAVFGPRLISAFCSCLFLGALFGNETRRATRLGTPARPQQDLFPAPSCGFDLINLDDTCPLPARFFLAFGSGVTRYDVCSFPQEPDTLAGPRASQRHRRQRGSSRRW